jgi:Flp pilus assembly protein TadD
MMRGFLKISYLGALIACAGGVACVAAPAAAQGSYSPYNETAASALARYVRTLAQDPKNFDALIGAGRAALEIGDAQAAAGFFARADEVNPRSPLPQEGMGAVQVANGDGKAAMPYFTRAQQLGATQAMIGCDRGLAYDLLGQQASAQADYKAALGGPDGEEARRRLALSLAISGDRSNALAALAPLSASGDAVVSRVRAFVLALTGDSNAATSAINAAMPGSSSSLAPFLHRLQGLPAGQKAAAVNLGIFPDSSQPAYAYSGPAPSAYQASAQPAPSTVSMTQTVSTDRLAGVDALLGVRAATQPAAAPPPMPLQAVAPTVQQAAVRPQPVQAAYSPSPRPAVVQRTEATAADDGKIWLELGSGQNASALSQRFARMKSDNSDIFKGITAFVAQGSDRAHLIIGPFRGTSDADIFEDDLHTVGIAAFRYTNSDSARIVPVATE